MIIVKLKGGLGNQMFQYAFGRNLAIYKNTEMKLDAISGFQNDAYERKYSLSCFNIFENFASREEIAKFKKNGIRKYIYKVSSKLAPYYKRPIVEEQEKFKFRYDKNMLLIPDNAYLDGYWQNESYFNNIKDVIKREFTFKFPMDHHSQAIAEKIINSNSVSIHFRRLHGVSTDKGTIIHESVNFHGACPLDYYQATIKNLLKQVNEPLFFIFSDDYNWAQENFKIDYPTTFIDHNGISGDYEDLRLMSLCKHHIIANSSFSWWGAWLCENPEKKVFAPKYWDTTKTYIKDITPASWGRI